MFRVSVVCVCVSLSLLLIQVLGGNSVEKRRTKAEAVCSKISAQIFYGHTVAANYAFDESQDVVSVDGCPVALSKTPPILVGSPSGIPEALLALTEIKYWVCSNLRKANAARVKPYIDAAFYTHLLGAIDGSQESLRLISLYANLANEDALDIVRISEAAEAIETQVAGVVRRLPCFCRLLELMGFGLTDRRHNRAMCLALFDKSLDGRAYKNVYKAAQGIFWKPTIGVARLVPQIGLLEAGSCTKANLDSSWERNRPLSWFKCAAKYAVDGYEVYMAPKGLMLYHGSLGMPAGMMWFGDLVNHPHDPSAVPPSVYSFRTMKNIFLVHLMVEENNELMAESLPSALKLERVTGYPGPLRRLIASDTDKPVFAHLCDKWPRGIAGYADSYPEEAKRVHPELLLCKTEGFIEPLGPVAIAVEPEPEVIVLAPRSVEAARTTVEQFPTFGVPEPEAD